MFDVGGKVYYEPQFLSSGVTMKRAQEICTEKGMMLFEPRDATINRKVWQAMKTAGTGMYWLNLRREDPSKNFKYDSDKTTPQYTHWAPGMLPCLNLLGKYSGVPNTNSNNVRAINFGKIGSSLQPY